MISFQNAEYVIFLVLMFFAYVFSITLSGTVQAYVAYKLDDEMAADLGFTEFNPFLFINLFDILWFLAFKIMIGRPIPIDLTYGIDRTYRWWPLRLFILFASRPLCNLFLAVIALFTIMAACTPSSALALAVTPDLSTIKESMTSMSFLFCAFCGAVASVNIFLATFETFRQAIHFFVLYKMEKDFLFIEYADYILVLGPLLLWIFFHQTIISFFSYIINCLVFGISKACGVL